MVDIATYPTFYDKLCAEISNRFPWANIHHYELMAGEDFDDYWIYPVIYGPEEYL